MGRYNDLLTVSQAWDYANGPRVWNFEDDFNDLNLSATAQLAKWTYLSTDSGNTALQSITKGGGVVVLAFSTPTDEDVIHLAANTGLITGTDCQPNTPIRFETRFQLADVSHNDLHIGFSIHDTSMAASEPDDWVGFRCLASEGAGDLNLIVRKNGTSQQVDPVCTLADATWVRAAFEFWPTTGNTDSGTLYYTVHTGGSVYRGTVTVANTWPDDVFIAPFVQVQIEGTDGDAAYVDWIKASAVRAEYVDGTG